MCRIAGIFHYREPARPFDRGELERMTRALAHRGPDGERVYVSGPVGQGHRPLAIVPANLRAATTFLEPVWTDVTWKLLCIDPWARAGLDAAEVAQ